MTASPTPEEWRRLLETVVRYKKLGCWQWMENEDYFAVTNPDTGEVGYCVVLGAGGMNFGFNVYIGSDANLFLQEITDSMGVLNDDQQELSLNTNAISLTFEDRSELDKEDLRILREQGLKFRGSQQWPLFRSYEPGRSPWSLNSQQVGFLTIALEQGIHVAERFREDRELYFEHDEADNGFGEKRLHRVPQKTDHGIEWRDEWLPWRTKGQLIEPYVYPDEVKLQSLKKLKKSKETWEADFDYAVIAIGDTREERPYYPRLCLWVNKGNSMIMDVKLGQEADCRELFVQQLIRLLEKVNYKPAKIEVGSNKAFLALQDSAERLAIPIRVNPHLEALLEAKYAIEDRL
ncbi:DUF7309 domain-containing protein [Cohnella herbarum]|uniref:Uncharacterized protein n=1 Tax=Cohnella herbarum TaxID=2728023 RepID=A0A7Z2ZNK8_9BACL|nr:hypothetical protein [Cohnella herbarum]QJD86556.1 hypothetical protein HH215_27545 [Cohnella herbarum]